MKTSKNNLTTPALGVFTHIGAKPDSARSQRAGVFFSILGFGMTSNRRWRFCRPLHYHFATAPLILLLTTFPLYAEVDLRVIAQIESSGNPKASGDSGKSLGLYQLSQDVVSEYNTYHNTSYLHQDALDSTISRKIASWYLEKRIPALLRHFKKPDTLANRLTAYNAGISAVVKGRVPKTTRIYIEKYKKEVL